MKLIEAVEQVLDEHPNARMPEYAWVFICHVLRKLGYKAFIEWDANMPSPETIFREKREIMNKRNRYAKDFKLEDNVTIERPGSKHLNTSTSSTSYENKNRVRP